MFVTAPFNIYTTPQQIPDLFLLHSVTGRHLSSINELDGCIVRNAHNAVFGSKRSAIDLCTSCLLHAFYNA